MDGTLVDSMGYWDRLGREYLESRGVTEGIDEALALTAPMTMLESSELFLRTFGLSGTPESAAAEMNAVMDEHYRSDIPLKPGAADYLAALKARGTKMCVATATPEPLAHIALQTAGIDGYFAFVASSDTTPGGKENPAFFTDVAARFGVPPTQMAMVEDALYSMRTAHAVGCYCIGAAEDVPADTHAALRAICDEFYDFSVSPPILM